MRQRGFSLLVHGVAALMIVSLRMGDASLASNPFSQSPAAKVNAGEQIRLSAKLIAKLPDYEGQSIAKARPVLLAFSPDMRLLAYSGENRTVKLCDAKTGGLKATLIGDEGGISGFAFSPDGHTAATRDVSDRTVRLWDIETGKLKATFAGRKRNIETKLKALNLPFTDFPLVTFSPDGQSVLTEREDDIVGVWDVATGKQRALLEHDMHSSAVKDVLKQVLSLSVNFPLALQTSYSPDGRTIVTANGDNAPKIWDAATGQLKAALSRPGSKVYKAVFSPDGQVLATSGINGVTELWDVTTGKPKAQLGEGKHKLYGLRFSPNGRIAATSVNSDTRLWDVATGKLIAMLPKSESEEVFFSPDGRFLATEGENNRYTAKLWEVATGQLKTTLAKSPGKIHSTTFSPDTRIIVTTSDKGVKLWDATNGELLETLNESRFPVRFSADGHTLATGGREGTAMLWEIRAK